MIEVKKITTKNPEFSQAKEIRYKVFVEGQKVPEADEFDEFEDSSFHFVAIQDNTIAGTARWRRTDKGAKLERFAVLESARGQGIGKALVQAVLDDVKTSGFKGLMYMHAQVDAIPLYAHFDFQEVGELFDECGIIHREMEKII